MNERQHEILRIVVQQYIDEGEPISSAFLAGCYPQWNLSPATVRNELLVLTQSGFLEQPHTSAGRVPTAKGYRFFVDHFLPERPIQEGQRRIIEQFESIARLTEFLAQESHSLVLSCYDPGEVYEAGLTSLLEEPEFDDHEFLVDFIKQAERLRAEFSELTRHANSHPHLYIGDEGKNIVPDDRFSFLLTPLKDKGFVLFFSSTRMNYAKSLALANFLSQNYAD